MADIINSKIGEQQSLIKKEEEDKRNFESYLQKLVLDLTQMKFKVTELKTLTERSTKENGICEKKIFFFSFFFLAVYFFFLKVKNKLEEANNEYDEYESKMEEMKKDFEKKNQELSLKKKIFFYLTKIFLKKKK